MRDVESKHMMWYGHVQRMEETRHKKNYEIDTIVSLRERGRRKKTWKEGINTTISASNLREGQ